MTQSGVDLKGLERKARESEERESFEVIDQTGFVRISGGARIAESGEPVYFIEITVYPCPPGTRIDVSLLDRKSGLMKDIERMGYNVLCQEGGFMVGERRLDPKDFGPGLKALRQAVTNRFGTGGGR